MAKTRGAAAAAAAAKAKAKSNDDKDIQKAVKGGGHETTTKTESHMSDKDSAAAPKKKRIKAEAKDAKPIKSKSIKAKSTKAKTTKKVEPHPAAAAAVDKRSKINDTKKITKTKTSSKAASSKAARNDSEATSKPASKKRSKKSSTKSDKSKSRKSNGTKESSKSKAKKLKVASKSTGPDSETAIAQPTPKRSKLFSRKPLFEVSNPCFEMQGMESAVTPSPTANRSKFITPWPTYDRCLKGGPEKMKITKSAHESFFAYWKRIEESEDVQEREFYGAMKSLVNDSLFCLPFGVKESLEWYQRDFTDEYYMNEWLYYAIRLASYPKERLMKVQQEFATDRKLHAHLLKELTEEISERRQGVKRFYLRALNCMFFDAFTRCDIPPPPLPIWKLSIDPNLTRKEIYHQQLRAWGGFKCRAFAVVMTVAENTMDGEVNEGRHLAPITPLLHRGAMVPMSKECMNEEKVIRYSHDWSIKKRRDLPLSDDEKEVENERDVWCGPVCECADCKTKFTFALNGKMDWDEQTSSDSEDDSL